MRIKLEYGESTYRVVGRRSNGYTVYYGVYLLPGFATCKAGGQSKQRDWVSEVAKLLQELSTKQPALSRVFDMSEWERLSAKDRVQFLHVNFPGCFESLPAEAFDEKVSSLTTWSWKNLYDDSSWSPLLDKPVNRLSLLDTVQEKEIPQIRDVFRQMRGTRDFKVNLYQCTCGRIIARPAFLGDPVGNYASCGCANAIYVDGKARLARSVELDAWREYMTMFTAVNMPGLSVYPNVTGGMPDFDEFFMWYEASVSRKPLSQRFVARIDKQKGFSLNNLKIVDSFVDRVTKNLYIDL